MSSVVALAKSKGRTNTYIYHRGSQITKLMTGFLWLAGWLPMTHNKHGVLENNRIDSSPAYTTQKKYRLPFSPPFQALCLTIG